MKYLGETFDIHGGGADLIFPHHENEIAQSEAATHSPFVHTWLHNGFVTIDKEKMSKSLRNYVSLADVLRDYPAAVVRYLVASGHYRSQIDFSPDVLTDAQGAWSRLASFARNARAALGDAPAEPPGPASLPWREKFLAAMSDDFNTPEALGAVFDLVSAGNAMIPKVDRGDDSSELAETLATFRELTGVLGMDPIGQWPERSTLNISPLVEDLLTQREEARKAKDFARADRIRDLLKQSGIAVEDRAGGPRWYLVD
jgi:cysteinyl-tRNA synthetase